MGEEDMNKIEDGWGDEGWILVWGIMIQSP